MKENTMKAIIAAAGGAFGAYFGQIMVPVLVMTAVVLLDYITGLTKAWAKGELCSKVGFIGILKKLMYYVIVAVAMVIDYIIRYAFVTAGISFEMEWLVSIIVIIWLSINECISILENVAAIGVPVPAWLLKLVERLKTQTEEKVTGETEVKKNA